MVKITLEKLDIWNLTLDMLQDIRAKAISQYMEYPSKESKRRFVIQSHQIGRAQHVDFRMEMNDHLVGWSIVGANVEDPHTPQKFLDNIGKGYRAETKCWSDNCNEWQYRVEEKDGKFYAYPRGELEQLSIDDQIEELARQPKVWLKVKGEIKPGEVGAGVEAPGTLGILATGQFWEGAQKPYFHEYFVKGGAFKKWTRMIIRGVRIQRIDPETKKPKAGRELMWRFMIPKDQVAYAMKRGITKKWKPPKGVIPIPPDQRSGDLWEKWQAYMKGKEKEEKSKTIDFTAQMNTWMGPIHVRAVPRVEYYLRLDDKGTGPVRTFFLDSNPLKIKSIAATDEGRAHRKYLTFEGKISPGEKYNPTKSLITTMTVLDKGKAEYESEVENGVETISLNFKGKRLRGKVKLVQEEKGADFYTFEHLSQEILVKGSFVLQRHYWDQMEHFDVRMDFGKRALEEFNLFTHDPLATEVEEPIKANFKYCYDPSWMQVDKAKTPKKVGGKITYVDPIDKGEVSQIESTESFMSFIFKGNKMKGYWVARKTPESWIFKKGKLPSPEQKASADGDPKTGDFYSPFLFEQKKGWDYYWIRLYDIRKFTRAVSDWKKYLPDLTLPAGIQDILIGLYHRPGTIHGARVMAVKVNESMNRPSAASWIRSKKLHTWSGALIREKRKPKELMEILDEEELTDVSQETVLKQMWIEVKHIDLDKHTVEGFIIAHDGKTAITAHIDSIAEQSIQRHLENGYKVNLIKVWFADRHIIQVMRIV